MTSRPIATTLFSALVWLSLSLLPVRLANAQGTVNFNNRILGTGGQFTHIWGPSSTNLALSLIGQGSNDSPSGTTPFGSASGMALIGAGGSGGHYGYATTLAQLIGAEGSNMPESALVPVGQTTTFRSGSALGDLASILDTLTGSPGIPADAPYATFEIVAWDYSSGLYPSWYQASVAWTNGWIAAGHSAPFTVTNIGGGSNSAPNLNDFEPITSFNLYGRGIAEITSQPTNQTVPAGTTVNFSVTLATGDRVGPPYYHWKKDGSPLTDGGNVSGATNATLTLTNVVPSDAGTYTVVVSNCTYVGCGSATSSNAILTVTYDPAAITTQPQSLTGIVGTPASFTVAATGTAPLSYQWRFNGTPIGGATSTLYSLATVQSTDAGSYDVVVTNLANSVTSTVATLTVATAPVITTQPQSLTNLAGTPAAFTVAATGGALSYQWRFNGTPIGGATTTLYSLASVRSTDAGSYDVVVTNVANSVTSTIATLTVLGPDIGVLVDGTDLVNGVSTVSFGTTQFGQTGPTLTFTVTNAGTRNLTLGAVTLSGSLAGDYVLDTSGLAGTVVPGGSTTFTVAFRPTGYDLRSTTLQIASNDPDESPFTVALSGRETRVDPGFNPDASSYIYGVAVQADGKILLGGGFTNVGATARNRVARVNADGTLDPGFNPNADSEVNNVAVQADGKILLGGGFTSVGGTARNGVARVNADGTLDPGFNPNANAFLRDVAVQADGKILLAGYFTTVGGTARTNIARVNADGTLDSGFNPRVNGWVESVAVQADGKILLGGSFTTVGGTAHTNIARVNANGTLDFESLFNTGVNGWVESVAVQADGKILLGGSFTKVGGTARNFIARLYADGTLDSGFNPNANSTVCSMAVQADGKILLGGYFSFVGGKACNRVARVNPDGTLDSGFNPSADGTVCSVAVQADGEIVLGGNFTAVDGMARNNIARLLNEAATQTLTVSNSTQVQWLRGGTAPEVEQVTFELSSDGGSTWTALGSGARITGGWAKTGLSLPANGSIRARGRATAGQYNGSSSLIEQMASYAPPSMRFATGSGDLPLTNGTFQMHVEIQRPAGTVVIQASTNFAGWLPLFTNTMPTNLLFYTDPNASNYLWRFYRAVWAP